VDTICYIINQKKELPTTTEENQMKTIAIENGAGRYDGQGDYEVAATRFDIVQETEKAIKVSRIVESKNKSYDAWFPKSAFTFPIHSNVPSTTDLNSLKKWFTRKMNSYQEWIITAH